LASTSKSRGWRRPTVILILIIAICVASVATALISQHLFDMQPCPWCILQRVIFLAIALVCMVGLLWDNAVTRVTTGSLVILLAISGVWSAVWQHFYAANSLSCNLTLADKIISIYLELDKFSPEVFAVRASCAEAAVKLFGVPYDFWSLGLFVLIGSAAFAVAFRLRGV